MAEGEPPAAGEKEDNFNSSLNSQQTTGASSDGNRPLSTTEEEEEGEQFEGTLQSDGSKEYSFGTTEPPKLPKAREVEDLACARSKVESPPKAVNGSERDKAGLPPKLPKAQSQDLDELACATTPFSFAGKDEQETKKDKKKRPDELQTGSGTPTFALQDEANLRVRSESKDNGGLGSPCSEHEAFTFGTTNPLKLPDPALLRQAANTDKPVEPKVEEGAIVPVQRAADERPTSARQPERNPRHQILPPLEQPHPHVPLPPIMEPHPMPPMLPPDEAVDLRSTMLSSPMFQGELACYASPPPHQLITQAPFMPHQLYPGAAPVAQPWTQPVCFPAQQFSLPYAAEVSASPEESALYPTAEQTYQEDYDPTASYAASRRGSLMVNCDPTDPYGYPDTSEEAALNTSDFDNEASLEKLTSVVTSTRRNRILAAGGIVLLVALAGGCVVLLAK